MSITKYPAGVSLALAALAGAAGAQTVTVTISSDVIDVDWETATIADLPGPDGEVSFSEAMIATNHTPGHQTIGFAIPESDWILQFIHPGKAVLTSTTGFFFRASDQVTIDGTTQTAFTGDTNPEGWEVVIYGDELYLNADGCTLIGFDSTSVSVSGSNGLIEGNTGTMNVTLFGGSGSRVEGNSGGTIKIDRSDGNLIVGNTVQRVRISGFGMSEPAANNRVGGPDPEDRNFLTGYGTWNSEGLPAGAAVELTWTVGTVIENNSIGTTPDGLEQGNLACTMGISLRTENQDLTVRNNRMAGILGHGMGPHHAGQLFGWAIYFWGTASNVEIVGNTIGLDAAGEPLLGSVWGVSVDNFAGYTLSDVRLLDNVIAGHILNGVTVVPTANMRISRTEIYENGWLGIDLIPTSFGYGVTANDANDADSGANGLQNFPEIDSATPVGSNLRILGTLQSSASSDFTIELFASAECDASGFGEGEIYLGATSVSTDALGHAAFDVSVTAPALQETFVTSTATLEPTGETSEFSACLAVEDTELLGTAYCDPAVPNSTGQPGVMLISGSDVVADDDLTLTALQLPPGPNIGYFIMGTGTNTFTPPGAVGSICVAPGLKRFLPPVNNTAELPGGFSRSVGTSGPVSGHITAGSTWNFQAWHRDGMAPSNLTNARSVTFQ